MSIADLDTNPEILLLSVMSQIQQKLGLKGIRFFAYHGFYPIEQVLGNEFFVDIEVAFEVTGSGEDNLAKTVNYEQLYQITASEMNKTKKLIETVAHEIIKRVQEEFTFVKTSRVVIRKTQPAIQGEVSHSFVDLIAHR